MLIYMSMIDSDEDKDLFEGLYLKYRKHMKYIAMQILGDEYLAEDAFLNFATPFDFHYHDRLVFLDLCRFVKKLIFDKPQKDGFV